MFLHLGGEVVAHIKDIIAILDIESTLKSPDTRDFLKVCEEEEFISRISEEEPRSFVITEKLGKTIIYYSPISALTLQKRAGFIDDISID